MSCEHTMPFSFWLCLNEGVFKFVKPVNEKLDRLKHKVQDYCASSPSRNYVLWKLASLLVEGEKLGM